MSFNRHTKQDEYLEHLSKGDLDMFDFYYLFMLLGIASDKKVNLKGREMLDYFPQKFQPYQEIIAVMVILSTMLSEKFDPTDREKVKRYFEDYLSVKSPNPLKDLGSKAMNAYSNGGFILFKEKYPAFPEKLSHFAININKEIEKAFEKNKKNFSF
tara:strand:+ start:24 stop:491 length:468 start_codon:yes stop_codon:yes gene_type:complete